MFHIPPRSHQPALFGSVPDEQRRSASRLRRHRPADGQQRDGGRRVVVGAVPDGVAVHGIALAVVILVRAEQHVLAGEPRVTSGHLGDDVDRRIGEALGDDRRDQPRIRLERRAPARIRARRAAASRAARPAAPPCRRDRGRRCRAGNEIGDAVPLIDRVVGHDGDNRGRRGCRRRALDAAQPGPQRRSVPGPAPGCCSAGA